MSQFAAQDEVIEADQAMEDYDSPLTKRHA